MSPERAVLPPGERVYAVGDVHGRVDLFERLVGQIREDNAGRERARVRLILLGDLVDRGPQSAELVRRCMAFAARTDRFVVLKGNHEAMMAQAIGGDQLALSYWLRAGGDAALSSWGVPDDLVAGGPSLELLRAARGQVPEAVLHWVRGLPLTHQVGGYLFVHAGVRPDVALAEQTEEDLLWIRREFLESGVDHGLVVVHGHSVTDRVSERPNRIGIDTGAYRTGRLTALGLEGDRRWTLATGGRSG